MTQIHQGKLTAPDHVIAYLTNSRARGGWRDHPTYRQFFEGAVARTPGRGYRVEELWLGDHGFSGARLSRVLYARGVRGVIVGPIASSHGHLNLRWEHFCTVAIGYSLLRPALDRVSNDQYDSTLTALRELRRQGYRRVGIVGGARALPLAGRRPDAPVALRPDRRRTAALPGRLGARGFLSVVPPVAGGRAGHAGAGGLPVAAGGRPPGAGGDRRRALGLVTAPTSPGRGGPAFGGRGRGAVDAVIERVNNNELGVPAFARTVALPGKWVVGEPVRCVAQQRASPRCRSPEDAASAPV